MSQSPAHGAVDQEEPGDRVGPPAVDPALQRGDPELHREEELEQDREPEGGDGKPRHGEDPQDMVDPRVPVHGRDDPKRDPDDGRQGDRDKRKLERRRKPVHEIVGNRPLCIEADAEVALRHADHIVPELHRDRLVDSELGLQRRDLLGRGVVAGDERNGIGRDDVADGEGDHQKPQQGRARTRSPDGSPVRTSARMSAPALQNKGWARPGSRTALSLQVGGSVERDPAHLLTVADRAEAHALDVLVERAEPLGVVDEDAGGVLGQHPVGLFIVGTCAAPDRWRRAPRRGACPPPRCSTKTLLRAPICSQAYISPSQLFGSA